MVPTVLSWLHVALLFGQQPNIISITNVTSDNDTKIYFLKFC